MNDQLKCWFLHQSKTQKCINMEKFILLLRSEDIDFSSYSPEDYQKLFSDFETWNEKLEQKGLHVSVGLSCKNAQSVRLKDDQPITDGPYCETKEAISGFCVISAPDRDEAIELASKCPFLPRGGSVEVRGISQLDIENKEAEK